MKVKELIKILKYTQSKHNDELYLTFDTYYYIITKENGSILYEWEKEDIRDLEDFIKKESDILWK